MRPGSHPLAPFYEDRALLVEEQTGNAFVVRFGRCQEWPLWIRDRGNVIPRDFGGYARLVVSTEVLRLFPETRPIKVRSAWMREVEAFAPDDLEKLLYELQREARTQGREIELESVRLHVEIEGERMRLEFRGRAS